MRVAVRFSRSTCFCGRKRRIVPSVPRKAFSPSKSDWP